MMRELGSVYRLPCVPDDSRNAPMDAAIPTHTVFTSCGDAHTAPLVSGHLNCYGARQTWNLST